MKTRVAINGFGRIGRNVFKVLLDRDDVEIVAINDLTDNKTLAHLLRFDTAYGQYAADIQLEQGSMVVGGHKITMVSEPDPEKLPWADHKIDVVIESTGRFTSPTAAQAHVRAGAGAVVISAPAKGEGAEDAVSVIIGVNDHQQLEQNLKGRIVTNASCTTNCISPVASVLESAFGIEMATMTTIHSYTASQNLQDGPHKDLRSARAAAENIIPATTGAAIATTRIIPELEGKFDGLAIRVPSVTGSMIDMVAVVKRDVTVDEVKQAFVDASSQPYYQGVLSVTDLPLVSSDIRGDSHSAIVDLDLTRVVGGRMVKVMAWYDNEWGYSNRLAELTADVGVNLHQNNTPVSKQPAMDETKSPDPILESTNESSQVPVNVGAMPAPGLDSTTVDSANKISASVASPNDVQTLEDISGPMSVEDMIAADEQLFNANGNLGTGVAEPIIGFGDTDDAEVFSGEMDLETPVTADSSVVAPDSPAAEPVEGTTIAAETETDPVDDPVSTGLEGSVEDMPTDFGDILNSGIKPVEPPKQEDIKIDEISPFKSPPSDDNSAESPDKTTLRDGDILDETALAAAESHADEIKVQDSLSPTTQQDASNATGSGADTQFAANDAVDQASSSIGPVPGENVVPGMTYSSDKDVESEPIDQSAIDTKENHGAMLDDLAADMDDVRMNQPEETTDVRPTYSDIVKPHKPAEQSAAATEPGQVQPPMG